MRWTEAPHGAFTNGSHIGGARSTPPFVEQELMQDVKPTFETLVDALSFIERCLSNGEQDRLFGACVESCASNSLCPDIFEELLTVHVKRRLRSLYLDRSPPIEFPPDSDNFKLGGHQSELGHIHIDFQRLGSSWRLNKIWMCR